MIISHKHKFIFIKTEKTAGTSLEIALSQFCGADDVITRISAPDEAKRHELGFRGPQNFNIALDRYRTRDFFLSAWKREKLCFYNHCSAEFIRRYIDSSVWDSYFKFCFERNPWDKAISHYFWRHKQEPRPAMKAFIASDRLQKIKGYNLYTQNDNVVVDKIFRFEEIGEAVTYLQNRFGFETPLVMPQTKAGHRKDKRDYRDILDDTEREQIAQLFHREISLLGYEW